MQRPSRLEPTQQRSRERRERLLDAAEALIAATGSDGLRMAEIAERTGVSIGSLYQYFPDKSSILRTLAERYNAAGRACIEEALANVRTVRELAVAFAALWDTYYAFFRERPAMADIWPAIAADKTLTAFEHEESKANARPLAEAMARTGWPGTARERNATAFFIMQLGEGAMRATLALAERERKAAIDTYKRMALSEITRKSTA